MPETDRKLFVESAAEIEGADAGECTGVYAGAAFCRQALPPVDKFREMAAAAAGRGFSMHLVTPPLTEEYFRRGVELVEALAEAAPGAEVILNDLGLLDVVAREFDMLKPVAGRVLAFQKTDPVVPEILEAAFAGPELAGRREAFSHVSVNNPLFADFLAERRVERIELQNPLQGVSLKNAGMKYSMHTPYVFVSSTMYCGPAEHYTRPGRVPGIHRCSKHCMGRWYRLRPKGGDTVFYFRGNTIYAKNPVAEPPAGVDRIVAHRLPS